MDKNRSIAADYIIESAGPTIKIILSASDRTSKFGVIQSELSDSLLRRGRPPATVADINNLSEADSRQFFNEVLFQFIRFDALPGGVDFRIADVCSDLGNHAGVRVFQKVLGRVDTGILMDADLDAASKVDARILISSIGQAWLGEKAKQLNWPSTSDELRAHEADATAKALALLGDRQ